MKVWHWRLILLFVVWVVLLHPRVAIFRFWYVALAEEVSDVFKKIFLPDNGWVYFDEYAWAYHIVSLVLIQFNVDIPRFGKIPHVMMVFDGVGSYFCD
eukprot:14551133-Ditylum_brightwellii.AAC.1